ncbi:NAD(P)/FAD-dependent oxidoreductase [Chondromyces crocatus]|uniref:Monooxygenase n=1 Tax=Chondromyces crocatus TaxID=52 RepID=A0A0K1E6G8_CHOCO|nr:NAD(P)/FAD-dependent oxidoreductase [Chondromyces crocatus]AKT36470.1 monooxygenase [Chondromyces crocatus]
MIRCDVAIVGGGPAGLSVAIAAAARGLRAVVLERGALPVDKACGEGLLPLGVAALERAGALSLVDPRACAKLTGIRYVQEDGSTAEGRLPAPGGLGIRRTALSEALARRAVALGAVLRASCPALAHRRVGGRMEITTPEGLVSAGLLVAADGLTSRVRRIERLEAEAPSAARSSAVSSAPRFGLRRHFDLPPWSSFVEVHLTEGAEAYVTPVGADQVGVAMLWRGDGGASPRYDELLARFPRLVAQLRGAAPTSRLRGAGPFARSARVRVADRLVLVGDAAGYVDAVTGEGLSLALRCAEALGEILPAALASGATREALSPYEEAFQHIFRKYALVTHGLLQLAARPWLRRPAVRWLGRNPGIFEAVLRQVVA